MWISRQAANRVAFRPEAGCLPDPCFRSRFRTEQRAGGRGAARAAKPGAEPRAAGHLPASMASTHPLRRHGRRLSRARESGFGNRDQIPLFLVSGARKNNRAGGAEICAGQSPARCFFRRRAKAPRCLARSRVKAASRPAIKLFSPLTWPPLRSG